MMSKIAFLGLGAMGSRMAHNLLTSGHDLIVYSRTRERANPLVKEGATWASSPKEAALKADIVISMVTDNEASRAIWLDDENGAIHGLKKGAIAIESSTLTLEWTRELAGKIAQQGGAFLDAPVAGSRPQAEAKQLIYLVGGEPSTFEQARPVLEHMGGAIHYVGDIGQGMVLKLVVNAFFGIQVAAFGELLGLIQKAGLDAAQSIGILQQMPVTSPALKGISGLMLAKNYTPMFPIDLVEKDFRYAMETAEFAKAEVPTSEAVRSVYERAKREGYGADNIAGIVQLFAD